MTSWHAWVTQDFSFAVDSEHWCSLTQFDDVSIKFECQKTTSCFDIFG